MAAPDLTCKVGKITIRNPLLLASGILGESSGSMIRVYRSGAGGVVTKSIGMEPRDGYRNPTVYEFEAGMLNAMGLPNPGIEHFSDVISRTRAAGVFTVGSIFGGDENEFSHLAGKMEAYGVDAVELNLSCPHVEGFGSELGSSPERVRSVVGAVRQAVRIPVWAKMTPNVADMGSIAAAAEEAGADAIVAINTVRAMAISARLRRPVLSNTYGGLSGEAVKYVGLRAVYEIGKKCSIPVIGVGGVRSGEDVAEYLVAGASAVQIGTAVAERGPGVFGQVAGELSAFMEEEGFSSLKEMIGIARR